MNPGWLKQQGDGELVIALHVQPGAKQTVFAGRHGEALKLRLAAAPVEGKANAALCAYIADYFGLPRAAVALISGQTSRSKRVRICGASEAMVARLRALDTPPGHA